jgi:hypothetical protein
MAAARYCETVIADSLFMKHIFHVDNDLIARSAR